MITGLAGPEGESVAANPEAVGTVPADEHDPFEAFLWADGAAGERSPYPRWRELRREGPIVAVHPRDVFPLHANVSTASLPEDFRIHLVLGHSAALEVLRDGERFSSSLYAATIGLVMGRTILQMDEPEHGRFRALLQQAFTRRALARWDTVVIRPTVARLVESVGRRGRAELVREIAWPFPIEVIAEMLGLPKDDRARFHRWAIELISIAGDFPRAANAAKALAECFAPLLAARRKARGADLISELAHATLDGDGLADEDIFSFLRLLLPAGAETTFRSLGNLLLGLLTHPDQLEAVRRDRSLVDRAIEEALRWETPLTRIARLCREATVVEGVPIPAGGPVVVVLGAANRDEARWERPDEFDVMRPPHPHVSFAFGPHRCLGMQLARMEMRAALNALLDLPGLRLDPAAEDVHVAGDIFRSPRRLPVVFEPVASDSP